MLILALPQALRRGRARHRTEKRNVSRQAGRSRVHGQN